MNGPRCQQLTATGGMALTPAMQRVSWIAVLAVLLTAGCQIPAKTKRTAPATVVPVNPIQGKVAFLNADLKYVVVDFSLGRLPKPDQKLNVYRAGQKVGELRVSNQAISVNFAADIIAGEAKLGDEVRED